MKRVICRTAKGIWLFMSYFFGRNCIIGNADVSFIGREDKESCLFNRYYIKNEVIFRRAGDSSSIQMKIKVARM